MKTHDITKRLSENDEIVIKAFEKNKLYFEELLEYTKLSEKELSKSIEHLHKLRLIRDKSTENLSEKTSEKI